MINQLIEALKQQDRQDCKTIAETLISQKHNFEVFFELQR
jgi:hypothetical protein